MVDDTFLLREYNHDLAQKIRDVLTIYRYMVVDARVFSLEHNLADEHYFRTRGSRFNLDIIVRSITLESGLALLSGYPIFSITTSFRFNIADPETESKILEIIKGLYDIK